MSRAVRKETRIGRQFDRQLHLSVIGTPLHFQTYLHAIVQPLEKTSTSTRDVRRNHSVAFVSPGRTRKMPPLPRLLT